MGEKVAGTLLALINAATGAELRVEAEGSPATEFDVVSRHLLREFTRAAGLYIGNRRKARYEYRKALGPVLAGSLDMPGTMRLHAAGRPGLFAYHQGAVVRDELLDRLVLAGLDELDRAADALALDSRTLYDARWLAGALDEVRDEKFVGTHSSQFLEFSSEIERHPESLEEDMDLAKLAAVALLHRGFEPEVPSEGVVPRAWFIDLETLFEQAVVETLQGLMGDVDVDRGKEFERRMFVGGVDRSRTNPDVVVHQNGNVSAVGDVKYKSLAMAPDGELNEEPEVGPRTRKENRPDLYQVLIHAASLKAECAFLVYAADGSYTSRYLGLSSTGCQTWTVQVRPRHLAADLTRFVEECGLKKVAP